MLLEPGQIFASRYRVLRCIAEGGMGAIFEAEHTATERRVALKLLFPHIMGVASARKKFELEAKISARVNSPHIVEVLDAGFDEPSKSAFLVMELLEGQTLAERIYEQGPFAPREALRLLQQVAAGLDAAHAYRDPDGTRKPIVHRDLKPENLFLARTHEDVINAKILDYGIAKMLGDTTNLSQEIRGTPLFMAFEQITAGPLSAQTDIWAFGLIAFYMLAGMPYWRSAEREGISVQSLFAEIVTLPLELPSARLRELGSGIELPRAFDAWLLCCINREPSQRFPTVTAAVEALARVLDVSPEDRSPPSVRLLTSAERAQNAFGTPAGGKSPSLGSVPALAATEHPGAQPSRSPPSSPWHWVAAGALGGLLLLGVIAWLFADDHVAPSASAASTPAERAGSASESASSSSPLRESVAGLRGGTLPTETGGTPRAHQLENQPLQDERRSGDVERAPDGAADEASARAVAGERRVGAFKAPTAPPGDPRSSGSREDSSGEVAKRPSAEPGDGASNARTPTRTRKPAKRRRKTGGASSEAYRIR